MTECALGKICRYRTENASTDQLPYLSTESMQPNKMGVIPSEAAPSVGKARLFRKGDTLISNIRPYFKKIWQAEYDGCCSADVLVFEPHSCDSDYLYWLLSDDAFFAYMVASSKGTKMPRGDKDAIMRYKVRRQSATEQRRLAAALNPIRELIRISQRTNDYLAELRNTLVKERISSALEHGIGNWRVVSLKDVAQIQSGYSYKSAELVAESSIGMLGIKNFNRNGSFRSDGFKPLKPVKAKSAQYVALGEIVVAHTDLTQNADIIGRAIQVIDSGGYDQMVASLDLVKVTSLDDSISNEFLAALLSTEDFHNHCLGYVNGTTVLHLGKKALPEYQLKIPEDMAIMSELDDAFKSIAQQQAILIRESRHLERIRDALLPKLISGDIDVSKIEVSTPSNNHLSAG